MKALGKLEKKAGLSLYDAKMPEIGPNDLLVRVVKSSLCGTDLHIYNWDEWAEKTIPVPMTIGHEFFGIVEQVGSNVKGFYLGDRISGEGHIVCGICTSCRKGIFHLCPHTQGLGVNRTGCFAEYVQIPAFNAYKIPKEVSDDIASILDPLGNAIHTALSFDLVGEDVLITGAGSIGLMALKICQKVGARHIVITDKSSTRLEMAKMMGATRAINTNNRCLSDVLRELDIEDGFSRALEMSGSEDALHEIIEAAANGAKIALLGILPSKTTLDGQKVIFKSLEFKGIYGREMFGSWQKAIALLQEGLDISPIITHHFKPEDYQKAFQLMQKGSCGKIIIDWD